MPEESVEALRSAAVRRLKAMGETLREEEGLQAFEVQQIVLTVAAATVAVVLGGVALALVLVLTSSPDDGGGLWVAVALPCLFGLGQVAVPALLRRVGTRSDKAGAP